MSVKYARAAKSLSEKWLAVIAEDPTIFDDEQRTIDWMMQAMSDAFGRGRREGYSRGHTDGYDQGMEEQ